MLVRAFKAASKDNEHLSLFNNILRKILPDSTLVCFLM